MFNAEVSRLIASVTTLACSLHLFFLRLHNVSFGYLHFTIFKPNTAMPQSAPPPRQALTASRHPTSELRQSPHPIPPWRASSSKRRVTDWPGQKLRLPSLANLQKPS